MTLLLIILDTLIEGVVFVGIYLAGRFLIREARQGFPSLKGDPTHLYRELQVHHYAVVGQWNHYRGDTGRGFFHEACAEQYLKEMLEGDPYYEVYPVEENVSHHCQWCESHTCELCK